MVCSIILPVKIWFFHCQPTETMQGYLSQDLSLSAYPLTKLFILFASYPIIIQHISFCLRIIRTYQFLFATYSRLLFLHIPLLFCLQIHPIFKHITINGALHSLAINAIHAEKIHCLRGQKLLLVGGIPTPLKNDGVKVSWDDDDIPNIWKITVMFQTTNQLLF